MGGVVSDSYNHLSKTIWYYCINVWLAAVHTPGKNNETADYMPRLQNENTESGDYHQLSFKGFLKFFTVNLKIALRINYQNGQ